MSGRGQQATLKVREALLEVQEGSEVPLGGAGKVGRPFLWSENDW